MPAAKSHERLLRQGDTGSVCVCQSKARPAASAAKHNRIAAVLRVIVSIYQGRPLRPRTPLSAAISPEWNPKCA